MPLIRKQGASAPKELGLFWPMQTSDGMTVDVFIYASALQRLDPESVGPVGLLKRHRALLESIASEKFDRGDATGTNLLHITEEDLHVAQASEAKADDVQ
ncbi:hypothetical protein AB3G45_02435 [Shinella sp. S4-D37]|uniref:hypothetical protein n=1 Tax=Shinella sp. S4-D37 TaxID=3161999 RepID=UPI00346668DD